MAQYQGTLHIDDGWRTWFAPTVKIRLQISPTKKDTSRLLELFSHKRRRISKAQLSHYNTAHISFKDGLPDGVPPYPLNPNKIIFTAEFGEDFWGQGNIEVLTPTTEWEFRGVIWSYRTLA